MPLLIILLVVSYLPLSLNAETKSVQAHKHGTIFLNIAMVSKDLEIELTGPRHDFFGLEHEPRNAKELELVKTGSMILRNPEKMWTVIRSCKLTKIDDNDLTVLLQKDSKNHSDGDHGHHEEKEHKDDHHKDNHDKDHEDHHKDGHHKNEDHKDDHHDEEEHADLSVSYSYHCESQPTSVTLMLFKEFKNMENIIVQIVTSKATKKSKLNRKSKSMVISL